MIKKDILIKITLTLSKIAGFVFLAFAAAEIFIYHHHDLAIQWGGLAALSFGIKNVVQLYENKHT